MKIKMRTRRWRVCVCRAIPAIMYALLFSSIPSTSSFFFTLCIFSYNIFFFVHIRLVLLPSSSSQRYYNSVCNKTMITIVFDNIIYVKFTKLICLTCGSFCVFLFSCMLVYLLFFIVILAPLHHILFLFSLPNSNSHPHALLNCLPIQAFGYVSQFRWNILEVSNDLLSANFTGFSEYIYRSYSTIYVTI